MGADGDAGDASGAAEVTVHIRCSNGSKFSVQTALDATVGALKTALVERCDVPAPQQRLIYKGRILKDEQTLQSYGVESDHTIHLVRGSAPPNSSSDTSSSIPNNTSGVARDAGSNLGGAFGGASLYPGFGANGLGGTGASGLFGAGFPEFDQVQQQLTQNPNMMREILNMPVFQNLMNNPDILRNLIMSNPQMREIIDRNPDLAHILNDPNTLRQTLEAARNPELMREMMRNTDRAMSNIESSPEGFNMLRRMYETVQEPFLNATTMAGDTGTDLGTNPFAALLGNQGAAQSATQSTNSSTTGPEATAGPPAPNTNPLPNPWSNSTNTRSSASNARTSSISGLGGLDLPGLERMAGGMPDTSQLYQIMQNPAMQQVMQGILSNPQHLNQLLSFNPQMRSLLESNTQLREMLQNPEFLRQLSSPESLQQLLSLHQSVLSLLSRQQTGQDQNQTGGGIGTANGMGLELLMNMLGGLGAGGLGVPSNPDVPPEELYATQLSQLQEMGFFDTQENIRALIATAGNVHAAVERLLRNFGQ